MSETDEDRASAVEQVPPPPPADNAEEEEVLEVEPIEAVAPPPVPPDIEDQGELDSDVLEIEALPDEQQPTRNDDAQFYRREARVLAPRQPERAALMWIEAATVAHAAGADLDQVHGDLDAALELAPNAAWLVSRARRMLLRIGSYERTLKLGQREVKLGGDPASRAALLLESAAVIRYNVKRPEVALPLLRQSLEVRPNQVAALVALISICHQLGQHAETCQALEALADCLTHPGQRALCLYAAATLKELRLGDVDHARTLYRRALEADPHNVPASFALAESHRSGEQWDELCSSLQRLADLIKEPALRGELLLESGSLHVDRSGDLAAAIRDLARAGRAVPDHQLVLRRLAHAYELAGRTREAIETLRQLETLTADARSKATLLTQIGTMHSALNEHDQAAAAFRQALELLPAYMPALQEFGSMCRKRGDFEGLVTLGRQESESRLPAPARAVRYLELAEILDRRLGRPDEAVDAYRRAIELDPALHLAYWQLAALLRRTGRQRDLLELVEQHTQICTDGRTRAYLLLEAARLQSVLGETDAAINTLLAAGEDASPTSVLFQLVELLLDRGRHAELVELLLRHAELTEDPHEAEGRRIWAAMLLEQELDEKERALGILREVLKANPSSYPAIHATGRILHHLGAWEDLVKLYHHELTIEPDRPDAMILLCRAGRIIAERIGNTAAAIGAYAKALRHDPAYTPALGPLEHLVRIEGRWPSLVEVLKSYARATSDPTAGSGALCRAAEVLGWRLDDPEQALALYRQALEREPDSGQALLGLARLQLRRQDWSDAASALEQLIERSQWPEDRALRQLQLARLLELNLNQPPDLELYLQAASGPFGEQLREEVLRVRRLIQVQGLPQHLAQTGRDTPDDALAATHLLDAVHMGELGSSRPCGALRDEAASLADEPAGDMVEVARLAHQRQGDLAQAWALERMLTRGGCWRELAQLTENLAQLELDRSTRIQQLALAGEAYWRGEAIEDADRVSRECLNFDGHSLPALRTLGRVAEARQDWRHLAELRDRLVEACTDLENRLEGCLGAADLWINRVGDASRALASLSVALADDPNQLEAFARTEGLLRERGDFEEISRLYQRRIRACQDPPMRAELHWQHAALLRALRRPERAIAEVNELLQLTPGNTLALTALADLHEELEHWSDAAGTLESLAEHAVDPAVRKSARLRLAGLWVDRLHDPQRARDVLEQVGAEAAADPDVVRLKVRLATINGDWEQARQLLQQQLEQATGSGRVWALLQLAQIARGAVRDPEIERRCVTEALELVADDEVVLQQEFRTADDRHQLVRLAEEALEAGMLGDPLAVRHLLVRVLLDDLDDAPGALVHIEHMRASEPSSVEVAILHARVLERMGSRAEALGQLTALIEADIRCIPALRGVARVADGTLAATAASIVDALQGETDEHEAILLRRLGALSGPPGAFPDELLRALPDEREVEDLVSRLMAALVEVFPRKAGERLSPSHPAAQSIGALARSLRITDLVVELGDVARGVSVVFGEPLTLQLSPSLAAEPAAPAFRTLAGRALALGQAGALFDQLTDLELAELGDALSGRRPQYPGGQQLRKALLSHLPRRERKELDQIELGEQRLRAFRQAREQRADRAAVVLSGHPGAAVLALADADGTPAVEVHRVARFADLLRFAVSAEHVRLFQAVWGELG